VAYSGDSFNEPIGLECRSGLIGSLVDFGITTKFEEQASCSRKEGTQFCNQYLNDQEFKNFYNKKCQTKTNCTIGMITDYFKHIGPVTDNGKEICLSGESRVYV